MSAIIRLPAPSTRKRTHNKDRQHALPAPSGTNEADRRPDPVFLVRLAVLQAMGRCRSRGSGATTGDGNGRIDKAVIKGLNDLAASGCPTSQMVLSWIMVRHGDPRAEEGIRDA